MYRIFVLFIHVVVILGCTQGRWVKPGSSSAQTQQDFVECETASSLQPFPATLGEKRGANPDLSSLEIQKCMQNKGYQWVTGTSQPQPQEILKISDPTRPTRE